MDFIPGRQGPTVQRPTYLGDFHPYALVPSYSAERQIDGYSYHANTLVEIKFRHRAVDGTSRWIDLTSHRETDTQPLELLLIGMLRSRMASRGPTESRPDVPMKSNVLVVDGVETIVDFISLGASEVCVIPAGDADMRIALVVERSSEPGWSDEISIMQIDDLDMYSPMPTAPGH